MKLIFLYAFLLITQIASAQKQAKKDKGFAQLGIAAFNFSSVGPTLQVGVYLNENVSISGGVEITRFRNAKEYIVPLFLEGRLFIPTNSGVKPFPYMQVGFGAFEDKAPPTTTDGKIFWGVGKEFFGAGGGLFLNQKGTRAFFTAGYRKYFFKTANTNNPVYSSGQAHCSIGFLIGK